MCGDQPARRDQLLSISPFNGVRYTSQRRPPHRRDPFLMHPVWCLLIHCMSVKPLVQPDLFHNSSVFYTTHSNNMGMYWLCSFMQDVYNNKFFCPWYIRSLWRDLLCWQLSWNVGSKNKHCWSLAEVFLGCLSHLWNKTDMSGWMLGIIHSLYIACIMYVCWILWHSSQAMWSWLSVFEASEVLCWNLYLILHAEIH